MKKKYCKYCGGLLNKDRICTECGHKFFKIRIKKEKYLTIALAISTLVLLFISLGLYNDNNTIHNNSVIYKQQIADLNSSVEELNEQLDGAKKRYDTLVDTHEALKKSYDDVCSENVDYMIENVSLENELGVYYKHFGFCLENSKSYHKWNCYHIRTESHYYYNTIPNLKKQGLKPCLDCY